MLLKTRYSDDEKVLLYRVFTIHKVKKITYFYSGELVITI